ncbi:bifunctional Cof-type HAD-IIB family hydrolase/peptidylprolyl isomerase [Streptococcus ratti]|uniref:peptidylprolyl isomerase n=1 Tax=Streptococcus ratti FA-1 = DSM 20564 TaxID=699248 RepID=A0ABN0GXN6_STRRT|nr:Cof-type HAD-IIB family hydrolase [Streptococcus ratti]EJN95176.1 putative hydrolase [Streptococcus ratti FA-1 = DSM 20564]EMP69888.1 hydrolase [Streptococcus ratti FA-1 = DSM 20564]QEY07166.1 Cof-type HAD-IIB family hydrolase [Streptococcus ratti]VEI59595.1 hydrolase [Streptococcus mutans]
MDSELKHRVKKVKAVFFDIDDTLRIKDSGYMPPSITTVFESLKKQGILTGIASGRAPYGVVPEIRALEPDFFVTINGSYVIDHENNEIFNDPISKDIIEKYVAWCKETGIDYGFAGKDKAVVSRRADLVDKALVPVYGLCDVDPDFYQKHDVYHMWTFEDVGDSLQLPAELAKDIRFVRWHPNSSDVIKNGVSKASGLAHVLKRVHLTPQNVLFFGDGLNDLEMFDYVGITVAMGNGHGDLKEKADFITKNVEEDGILYALEELGLTEKEVQFPQLNVNDINVPTATIKTNHGDLTVKLFPEQAPKTVANFIGLAKKGYYDGVVFHRIIKDFMIQGGDPSGTGMGGESIYGQPFEDEFSEELYNLRGALSMANAGPNTNGSQFFIVQNQNFPYSAEELERGGWPQAIAAAYADNGGTPHLDRRHTVFGQLADQASYEVLDKIAALSTDGSDRPLTEVIIETIEVTGDEDW